MYRSRSHKQQVLFSNNRRLCFGGSLLNGSNPKHKRPLSSRKPIHLVLRANRSVLALPRTFALVNQELENKAKRFGVRIYKVANVGNHLHIVIRLLKVHLWSQFIRALTGSIAKRLGALGLFTGRLWKHRPYTRVIADWNSSFRHTLRYVDLNQMEAAGHIDRRTIRTVRDLDRLTNPEF